MVPAEAVRMPGVSFESQLLREASRTAVEYLLSRRNEDGGYTFARYTVSNAQDTYYAIEIFKMLDREPPEVDKTIAWLRVFPARDIRANYYVTKALSLCGGAPDPRALETARSISSPEGGFGSTDVYVEAPSEFNTTYMAIEILKAFGPILDADKHIGWLLGFEREDGAFGTKSSNVQSTYHAIAALHALGFPVQGFTGTANFVHNCEDSSGGFTSSPGVGSTYIEDDYCGIWLLDLLGERSRYPEETVRAVLRYQNGNGGFRRSRELGLSTFEDTYLALAILRKLGSPP